MDDTLESEFRSRPTPGAHERDQARLKSADLRCVILFNPVYDASNFEPNRECMQGRVCRIKNFTKLLVECDARNFVDRTFWLAEQQVNGICAVAAGLKERAEYGPCGR